MDTTSYITEYACKKCSYKKEEPMESAWISTNVVDHQTNELNEKYYTFEYFTISQYYDFLFDYKIKNNDLIVKMGCSNSRGKLLHEPNAAELETYVY